jgi:hypothetical protein
MVRRELVMRDVRIPQGVLERHEEIAHLVEIGGVKVWYPSDVDKAIEDLAGRATGPTDEDVVRRSRLDP